MEMEPQETVSSQSGADPLYSTFDQDIESQLENVGIIKQLLGTSWVATTPRTKKRRKNKKRKMLIPISEADDVLEDDDVLAVPTCTDLNHKLNSPRHMILLAGLSAIIVFSYNCMLGDVDAVANLDLTAINQDLYEQQRRLANDVIQEAGTGGVVDLDSIVSNMTPLN